MPYPTTSAGVGEQQVEARAELADCAARVLWRHLHDRAAGVVGPLPDPGGEDGGLVETLVANGPGVGLAVDVAAEPNERRPSRGPGQGALLGEAARADEEKLGAVGVQARGNHA